MVTNIKVGIDMEDEVTGTTENGSGSVPHGFTHPISSLGTIDLEISLSKGNFESAIIMITNAPHTSTMNTKGVIILCTETKNECIVFNAGEYGGAYHAIDFTQLSQSVYDINGQNIQVNDVWIDNTNNKLIIQFYNSSGSEIKYLECYYSWVAFQT